jgi:hypothetical protein
MTRALACALLVTGVVAAPAHASDASVRQTFRAGLSATQPGDFHSRARLVTKTIARLRADHATTPAGQQARRLAIGGYLWALWALRSQIRFLEHDSGEVKMAARDAGHADQCWIRAATRLRRAGALLGVHVGLVAGGF